MKLLLAVAMALAVAGGPVYPAWADHQSAAPGDDEKAGAGAMKEPDQRRIQEGEDQLRDKGKGRTAEEKVPVGQQQEIAGKIQSAQGDTIVVKTDDGRTINVNIAQIDPKIREVVRVNESITVQGVLSGDQMVAHVIQGGLGSESGSALPKDAIGDKPDLDLNKKKQD